ncbi:hypothetical protein Nepgr_021584 [Nepenthes gracilis]|uniref:Uncharacterized protein n=1 Tax=Nepenthes gracilis TaxID=150966 RepID=A0AAD3SX18_NEPGR|nr:hypothetical protein Nepgr_021584 [Nepenthes gracilis]
MTAGCYKKKIEKLIKRGHLNRFLLRVEQASKIVGDGEVDPPRNRVATGVVNMISTHPTGQDAREDLSVRKKKPKVESRDEVISFRLKKRQMVTTEGPIYGLDNELVPVQRVIQLKVTLETYSRIATETLSFLVVDLPSIYNTILGCCYLATFEAVTSIPHLKMKFLAPYRIEKVLGDQAAGRTCYLAQVTQTPLPQPIEDLDFYDETTLQQIESRETIDRILLDPRDPKKSVQIGSSLP